MGVKLEHITSNITAGSDYLLGRDDDSSKCPLNQNLKTIAGVVTGKLPAQYVANSQLCNRFVVQPISQLNGRYIENGLKSYEDDKKLNELLDQLVGKVLTEEDTERLAKKTLATGLRPIVNAIESIANDPGYLGTICRGVGNTIRVPLGIIGSGAEKVIEISNSIDNYLHPKSRGLEFMEKMAPSFFKAEEKEEPEFMTQWNEFKKEKLQDFHQLLKTTIVHAIAPIAKAAFEKSTPIIKDGAEKATAASTRWAIEKMVQGTSCAFVANCITDLSPMATVACVVGYPIAYTVGSKLYECGKVYSYRQAEADKREKVAKFFEKSILELPEQMLSSLDLSEENIASLQGVIDKIAKPIAANLADLLIKSSHGESIGYIVDELNELSEEPKPSSDEDLPTLSELIWENTLGKKAKED